MALSSRTPGCSPSLNAYRPQRQVVGWTVSHMVPGDTFSPLKFLSLSCTGCAGVTLPRAPHPKGAKGVQGVRSCHLDKGVQKCPKPEDLFPKTCSTCPCILCSVLLAVRGLGLTVWRFWVSCLSLMSYTVNRRPPKLSIPDILKPYPEAESPNPKPLKTLKLEP